MEKMMVVVFNNESKAYEGSRALAQLDDEGSIAIHAESVIGKNPDGTVTVKESDDEFPIRTVSGTAIGALIGVLGGPVGLSLGAMAGALAGSFSDLQAAGVDVDFLDEVSATLAPGKCAVIADVSEEWETPVDTRMEALGGNVLRRAKSSFEDEQRAKDVAALRAEIDQLKAEHAKAQADRKAKVQAKIDKLNAKLQAKLDQAKVRSEQIRQEAEAKIQALQKKAQGARADLKATLEGRISQIRQDSEESEAKARHLLAQQLREAADRVEG
jgi:uncharacterized membrane protein